MAAGNPPKALITMAKAFLIKDKDKVPKRSREFSKKITCNATLKNNFA
jgi:hypothetical protein